MLGSFGVSEDRSDSSLESAGNGLRGVGGASRVAPVSLNNGAIPSKSATISLNNATTSLSNATTSLNNATTSPNHNQSSHFPAVLDFIRSLTTDSQDSRFVVNYEREEPFVQLLLLNPAVYFHDVVSLCHAVVITGGTLQPVAFSGSNDVV